MLNKRMISSRSAGLHCIMFLKKVNYKVKATTDKIPLLHLQ